MDNPAACRDTGDTHVRVNWDYFGDHCEQWMRFSNGLAVDQWLWVGFLWEIIGLDKFKAPYDYLKHSRTGIAS